MLKEFDYSTLEVISAVKNINNLDDEKTVLITITFVNKEDSYKHLSGIEEMLHKHHLEENRKYIKLQCSYTQNLNNFLIINKTIKISFNDPKQKYRAKSFNEDQVSNELLMDIEFINDFFDSCDNELKKVYV
ncbi:hypothetical protein RaK2_00013 [Klebsiella phage vB_KleM_RaK2]|uniref:Uncharacterized protein n=1 Tax=Klebsiella phage vB_KleM_RaK2 TaxID=1147094 RepID=H6X3H0_9CAUD|nr:hypothetical protein F403_gp521 [Klebsiella phage vB_KleM_RaK2]AFA44286.1 hypothetical protein RaK2_00013 [Klebsiella phage vB_KleM_RaK2]